MKLRKLIAVLAAILMMASLPLSVFAEMGGDFPWTDTEDQMLIEQILERDGLIDGIWFPWFNSGEPGHNLTGNDLMAAYYNSSSSKDWNRVEMDYYGADKIYREIYNLKAMGYNIMAYGGSIYGEGVIFDENGDVLGIKEEYLNNARRLLNMCREIGMPVMWNVYFHASSLPSYYGIEGWHVIGQMLGNNEVADHYAERFVRPLCKMLAEYPDVVALVSIADEPENEINDLGKGDHVATGAREVYGVNQDDMIYFMQQINETVREELPGVARTVASNNGNKTIYRDFDLDLTGHNQYTDGSSFKSVESLIADADPILTEYNIGSSVTYTDDQYADKLITFREWMMQNGYKGGFQWCWMPNARGTGNTYYLQRTASDSTSFRKTVSLLKYYIDEYRAEYRGETIGLDAPVLYANAGDGKVLWIPSQKATTITIQRSDDGGSTWTNLVTKVDQSTYVDSYLVGRYTDSTTKPTSGYCYRIIAYDANGNSVTSAPNNLAGADKAYKKTYVAPTYKAGKYYITSTMTQSQAKLTSFGVEKNRPLSESVNLIQNGSFESTGGQWNNGNFNRYAQVVSDSTTPDGSKSLYFDTSAQSNEGWYTFTVTGLEKNTEYTFSSFLKGAYLANDNTGQASIGVIDPDTGKYMFYWEYFRSYPRASRETKQMYPTAYDNEWHIRSVTFNTGDRTTATIALYGYSSKMWVDGMALYETTNGTKYETGESTKAITSTKYQPETGAANAIADPNVNNASYWSTGAGYKQGFMSVASGKLTYTASSDPRGVRYTKWFDVKPGTDYYVTYTVNVTRAGSGRVAILDDAMLLPFENLTTTFSSTGTKTVTGCISTGKYDQLGFCVVDKGGAATIDNICFYEGGESIILPTEPSFDGYIINGDFEIGSSNGWENLWNSNTIEIVEGHDSLFAMKGTAGGQYTQVRQKITVEPNTDYIIEVWAKNVSGTTLIVKDMADANLKQTALLGSGSTWTKTTMEFNSGSNTWIHLGFMGSAVGNTWTVDDVKMIKKEVVYGVVNGDFEAGEQNWTFGSGSHAIVSDAHGGSKALQLTNPGQWGSAAEQTIAVDPNTSYTITWWYKATPGTGLFNLYVMNAAGYANMTSEGGQNYMRNYTGDWQQGTYVVNSGSATAMILKWSTEVSNPGTILVDDIVVTKTEDVCNHTYDNACDATCNLCGETRTVAGHSYRVTATTAATCGATGVRTYTCGNCNDSYTETIPATGAHTYDNDCDASCNVCGTTRIVAHTYSGACDSSCNVCGYLRLLINAQHTYDNDCDASCNVCGVTRTVGEHKYDSDCDADCNICGATRTVSGHKYDNDCDADCNVCGATRTVGEHKYDNDCDADCNVCGATRTVGAHKYDNDCDTDCNVCGATRTVGAHKYDNDCDADCNICGDTRTVSGHKYNYDCDKNCALCGEETRPEAQHEYMYPCDAHCMICYELTNENAAHNTSKVDAVEATCQQAGNVEYWTCADCGAAWLDEACTIVANQMNVIVPATGNHTYDNECDADCNICGAIRTVGEHKYDNDCDADCNVCGATRTVGEHTYDDEYDADCNVCGAIREVSLPIAFGGKSVSEDVSGLAFRFDVTVEGMQVDRTTAIYDTATIGAYALKGMGAVVSNGVQDVTVPAVYLLNLEENSASFAVRIINIPDRYYNRVITATPYLILEKDGVEWTAYGESVSDSYSNVAG